VAGYHANLSAERWHSSNDAVGVARLSGGLLVGRDVGGSDLGECVHECDVVL
jgi:hypothetical protein